MMPNSKKCYVLSVLNVMVFFYTINILKKLISKTYQFTILCKGDYVTHPKQH